MAIRFVRSGTTPLYLNSNTTSRQALTAIPNNEAFSVATLTSDATATSDGSTVTLGGVTYEYKTALTVVAAVKAGGTLTGSSTPATGTTVTLGAKTYTFKTALTEAYASTTLTASGNPSDGEFVQVGDETYTFVTALADYASATLTSTGVAPADGDTVTLGSETYTFKTVLSAGPDVPFEVLIGASAAAALDNLKSAVNATAGAGTTYGVGTTENADISATTNTDTTQLFVADVIGTGGNALDSTEVSTVLSFGAATLTGGQDDLPFEVVIGVSAAATLDNLKAAVSVGVGEGVTYGTGTTDTSNVTATTNTDTTQLFVADALGAAGNAHDSLTDSAVLSFPGATFSGGADAVVNEVLIGANLAAALDNLKVAVDAGAGEGTVYSTGTTNNTTVDATTNADTTQVFAAATAGAAGNALATTIPSGSAVLYFGTGETLTGGADATGVANEVLIGISAATSLDNIKSAVNGTAGEGTTYGTGTVANPDITATTNTDTTQLFVAKVSGTAGDALDSTEVADHLSFGGLVFAGGADGGVDDPRGYSNLNATAASDVIPVGKYDTATVRLYSDVTCVATLTVQTATSENGPWVAVQAGSANPSLAAPIDVNPFANGRVNFVRISTTYTSGNPRATLSGITKTGAGVP